MISRLLLLLSVLIQPVKAIDLQVGHGRFSIIDLGSLINTKPLVVDETKVRAYTLSGLNDEDSQSIIAIQGLSKTGDTDMSIDTQAGIYQFHLSLVQGQGQDMALGHNVRTKIYSQEFPLKQSRSSIVKMPAYINQYILAANPNLVSYQNIKDYYDKDFLKTFALITQNTVGKTDIVVPTQAGVYKFTINIGELNNDNLHHSFIDFN